MLAQLVALHQSYEGPWRDLVHAVATQLHRGTDLQIMFGVGGERHLAERELPTCAAGGPAGPCGSATTPGGSASSTSTASCWGAADRLADQLGELEPVTRPFLVAAADTAAACWKDRDQGIWEIRGEPRDFLYSKLMCWVALDRAIRLAGRLDAGDRVGPWTTTRGEIRAAILEHGWSERAGVFTQSFGSDELDASDLMLAVVGFLPGDDPRMRAGTDAIADQLTDERGLVYRYCVHDGLEGEEGTFLLCTFWLVRAQALAGEIDRARATFERAVADANGVGLLAEEVAPGGEEPIGNYPQAFATSD